MEDILILFEHGEIKEVFGRKREDIQRGGNREEVTNRSEEENAGNCMI